jgi:hypothetical protein
MNSTINDNINNDSNNGSNNDTIDNNETSNESNSGDTNNNTSYNFGTSGTPVISGFLSAALLSEMSGNNHPLTPPPAPHIQNYFSTASYTPLPTQSTSPGSIITSLSQDTSLPNIVIPPINISTLTNPFVFTGTNSSINSLPNTDDTEFQGFSPEEIEDTDLSDMPELEEGVILDDSEESMSSSDDVDVRRTTSLLRMRQLHSLPLNKIGIGITWEFELNYDWYKYKNLRYFSDCRTSRFLTYKSKIETLQRNKNITNGKYWILDKPESIVKINYIYFIIYYDITKSHIEFEFYGIFEEELNELKIIEQIIEMGIYGPTGRLHKPAMTATDGNGFNLIKVDYSQW